MALLNALVAFNPISGSYWMYAAIGVVAVIALIFLVFVKKEIVYVDPDTDYEIAHEKYGWGKKINVASAGKTGRKFVGWSYDEDGEKRLGKKTIRLFRTTELFAVWEKPVVGITIEEANAVVEFIYIDDATGKEIVKQICPLSINVPDEVAGKQVLGWAFEPSQGPLVTASDNDKSVLTLELYPVREGWDSEEAVEETAPVVEEPVVEETVEEPVAEETVEEVVEEPVAEEVAEEAPVEAPAEEPVVAIEPTIVPTYIDGNGNELDIRYSRSFLANVIQAEDNVKDFYSQLKNHILSYKGVKSRISWKFDSYNKGRDQLFKLKLRGKTICMYCALDPNEYDTAKYHHEAVDAKIFADVPMLVKVKSNLGLKKAKELVDIVMAKYGVELNPKAKEVDYVAEYPYEETNALIAKELIKVLQADGTEIVRAEPKVVEEVAPVVEDPVVVEETPVVEVVEEVVEEPVADDVQDAEIKILPKSAFDIKYSRSFLANVIQAEDKVKDFYSQIKNHILSYKGVKSRTSWKFESYNKGRDQLFKLKLRGKTICMYCALDPNEFDTAKYHHEAVDAKIFADVPMLVKIKSNLGLKKAKELVDIVMAKYGVETNAKAKEVDYVALYPYEKTDVLVAKALIKVFQVEATEPVAEIVEEPVVVEETPVEEELFEDTVEEVAEEVAPEVVEESEPEVTEEAIPVEEIVEEAEVEETVEETVEEPVVEETVEETVEEVAEEVVEESAPEITEEVAPVEETVEEPVAEEPVAEEVVEEAVEEVAEEVAPEAEAFEEAIEAEVEEEPVLATTVEDIHIVESVSADEVDNLVTDEVVDSLVEEDVEYITADDVKKSIVNVGILSLNYEAGETVDLASLKAKGLIHKKSKSVKILASGSLDKALTVKAAEFSEQALKMIILTGGTAVHTVSKVK